VVVDPVRVCVFVARFVCVCCASSVRMCVCAGLCVCVCVCMCVCVHPYRSVWPCTLFLLVLCSDMIPEDYCTQAEDVNFNGNTMLGRPNRITGLSARVCILLKVQTVKIIASVVGCG